MHCIDLVWHHFLSHLLFRYVEPQWQLLAANSSVNVSQLNTEECLDGWTFDRSEFLATTVSEVMRRNLLTDVHQFWGNEVKLRYQEVLVIFSTAVVILREVVVILREVVVILRDVVVILREVVVILSDKDSQSFNNWQHVIEGYTEKPMNYFWWWLLQLRSTLNFKNC